MSSALDAKKRYPSSVQIVEFEHLKNSPDTVWEDVLKFFELPSHPLVRVQQHNSSFVTKRNELETIDMFWMNLIAGRMLKRYGFQRKQVKFTALQLFRSILDLIPWTWYACSVLRRSVKGGVMRYLFKHQ